MLTVDHWGFQCARCGWKAESARTVNFQQSVAESLIRAHLRAHDDAEVEGARTVNMETDSTGKPGDTNFTDQQAAIQVEIARRVRFDLRACTNYDEPRTCEGVGVPIEGWCLGCLLWAWGAVSSGPSPGVCVDTCSFCKRPLDGDAMVSDDLSVGICAVCVAIAGYRKPLRAAPTGEASLPPQEDR